VLAPVYVPTGEELVTLVMHVGDVVISGGGLDEFTTLLVPL
jgi:hypothetical protein